MPSPYAHDAWAGMPADGEDSSRLKPDCSTFFLTLTMQIACHGSGVQKVTSACSQPG